MSLIAEYTPLNSVVDGVVFVLMALAQAIRVWNKYTYHSMFGTGAIFVYNAADVF
jgi:hypothetical protein